jgi:hypothetical protein
MRPVFLDRPEGKELFLLWWEVIVDIIPVSSQPLDLAIKKAPKTIMNIG